MSDCKHEDFEARVEVNRICDDGKGEEVVAFVAEVMICCAACGEAFGFRGPPAGHSWDEPRCNATATRILLPLMSPVELELTGPLAAATRGPMRYEVLPRGSAEAG